MTKLNKQRKTTIKKMTPLIFNFSDAQKNFLEGF